MTLERLAVIGGYMVWGMIGAGAALGGVIGGIIALRATTRHTKEAS